MQKLILIHGLGSDRHYWDGLAQELQDDFDVLALDLAGHGDEARRLTPPEAHPRALAATVAKYLSDRKIDRPHVVDLSLGGWVALELAVLGRCASVVAFSPAGLWAEGTQVRKERQHLTLGPLVRVVSPALPILTRVAWIKKVGLATNVARPERVSDEAFLGAARAIGKAKGYAACENAMVSNRFQGGGRITVPVTVAFGDSDRVFPAPTFHNTRELPERARIEFISDCGHAMTWDQPAACLALIRPSAQLAN